jgi:hypothetical protein
VLRTCREQEKGIPLLMELIFWGEDKEKKKKAQSATHSDQDPY